MTAQSERHLSVFEIIGPVMLGPSSSHTAGMARIGRAAGQLLGTMPEVIHLTLGENFTHSYRGHGTDTAIVGGLLGLSESDPQLRESLSLAREEGIEIHRHFRKRPGKHPNSVRLDLEANGRRRQVEGSSVGGGSIVMDEVDGVGVELEGLTHYLVIWLDMEGPVGETDLRLLARSIQSQLSPGGATSAGALGYGQAGGVLLCWVGLNRPIPPSWLRRAEQLPGVREVRSLEPIAPYGIVSTFSPPFQTVRDLVERSGEPEATGTSIADLVMEYEVQRSGKGRDSIFDEMSRLYRLMRDATERGLTEPTRLLGGVAHGDDGKRMAEAVKRGTTLGGSTVPTAIARAMGVLEVSGSMGQVVATPTAGSCGVLPGCLVTVQEQLQLGDDEVVRALFTAAGMGLCMAYADVSFSGSVGGCQGEVGVASAMTAAALVELTGGTREQVAHAMALALKNVLGLVCDPILGFIEVPCIKRNALGVANAFAAADMARAGIRSAVPPDEVIAALKNVQDLLPVELRGSGCGGLAGTPSASSRRA